MEEEQKLVLAAPPPLNTPGYVPRVSYIDWVSYRYQGRNQMISLGEGGSFGRAEDSALNLKIQGYQINMAVCFWYLKKSDLSSVQ